MQSVKIRPLEEKITRNAGIISLGSCFSTEMGKRLSDAGYRVTDNPFGVLFNPISIAGSLERLIDPRPFTEKDVIRRNTNPAPKNGTTPPDEGYVSFYHHGSFRRESQELFLSNANHSLSEASTSLSEAEWIIVTFGTAWVFRELERGIIVSNCHKHPASEFRRERITAEEILDRYIPLVERLQGKKWIFTVSPVRHIKDGLHGNQLSKAILLLAVEELCRRYPDRCHYFPSYEIVLDELRDYSWFGEDYSHPSEKAVDEVYERFKRFALSY